jgi:CubicO group peptidase (beta-lactamase class C family)
MMNRVLSQQYVNMHSILIAKENKLVVESYFAGKPIYGDFRPWNSNTRHNLHSVTKSFVSALVGLAMEKKGFGLDAELLDFFPEHPDLVGDERKKQITLAHALSMSSGLAWDEWSVSYDNPVNSHAQMYDNGDWIGYVLSRPMAAEPGQVFVYNSGLSITLGGVVKSATGQSVEEFCNEHLFRPLGILSYSWHTSSNGTYQTGGGLSLRPRDMLKFGLLFLNDGKWQGEQIINAAWTRESTKQQGPRQDYTYHWWLSNYQVQGQSIDAFFAGGRGGQYIVVFRELDMVVVFTAGNDNSLASSQPREMLVQFILPAIL